MKKTDLLEVIDLEMALELASQKMYKSEKITVALVKSEQFTKTLSDLREYVEQLNSLD